jgi:hypothetical protein
MTFYVDEGDEVVFVEPAFAHTWRELVERQARRERKP